MWPFIFDTAYTVVRRLRKRENIFQAHRSHLYQRLTIAGWSHRTVAALYGAIAAISGAAAVAPLFDPQVQATADHAALWIIAVGATLLVATVFTLEKETG